MYNIFINFKKTFINVYLKNTLLNMYLARPSWIYFYEYLTTFELYEIFSKILLNMYNIF